MTVTQRDGMHVTRHAAEPNPGQRQPVSQSSGPGHPAPSFLHGFASFMVAVGFLIDAAAIVGGISLCNITEQATLIDTTHPYLEVGLTTLFGGLVAGLTISMFAGWARLYAQMCAAALAG